MMSPGPLSPVPQTPITTEFRDNVLRRRFNFQIPPAAPVVKLKIPQKIDKPALRTDMVRRLEVEPHRINPSGVTSRAIPDSPRVQIPTDLSTFISPMSAYPSDGGFSRLGPPPTSINTNAEPKAKKVRIKSPQGLYHRFFPSNLRAKLERTMTMPKTETLIPTTPGAEPVGGRSRRVPYLSFAAIVGRNSTFHGLDEKGIIELAGVEYRALSTLLWVVPLVSDYDLTYWLFFHFC